MLEGSIYSDKYIIRDIQKNNKVFIKHLYSKNYNAIFDFIINNNGDERDAQRIFQEGCIMLIRSIKKGFFLEEKSLRTLLYSICRRQWIQELKVRSPFVVNINDKLGHIEFDEETKKRFDEDEILFESVEKSLAQLGEPGSTILKEYYTKGKTLGEITSEIGYSDVPHTLSQKEKYLSKYKKTFLGFYKNLSR